MRIRLTGDWVIGHEGGRHCLIERGEGVYQDARIIFVGHDFPGEVDVTHDYGKALIAWVYRPRRVGRSRYDDLGLRQPTRLAKGARLATGLYGLRPIRDVRHR